MVESESNSFYKKLTIKAIREVVKDFKTFVFDEAVAYKAGQYLTLVHYLNDEEIRRSYSITSAPDLGEPLTIGVKRIENGLFSRLLIDQAKVGDQLTTSGAGGRFILPEHVKKYKQVFFLAAGSGITPIFSLLKTVLHVYPHLSVVLIYSNSSEEKTIFLKEIQQLQLQYPRQLQVEWLYSNWADLWKAHLHRDLLEAFLKQYGIAEYKQTLFYICGPEAYMRMCSYVLKEAQVPLDNIKKEDFIIQKVRTTRVIPPDTETHQVTFIINDAQFQIEVKYPDAILKAAKDRGLNLPYSCEVGRCGNCLAHCLKGKVWHSYNEVLTDKELSQGLVLTCTGHPVGGDVVLEIK